MGVPKNVATNQKVFLITPNGKKINLGMLPRPQPPLRVGTQNIWLKMEKIKCVPKDQNGIAGEENL